MKLNINTALIKNNIWFIFIILVGIWFNFAKIEYLYTFNWDQERDVSIIQDQMIDKKDIVLLGPRVVDDTGFFLGPLHYYLHLPFYILYNGNPLAGIYANAFYSFISILIFVVIVRILYGHSTSVIFGFLFFTNPVYISWNVSYIPLFTSIILYLCYKLYNKEILYLPYIFFVISLSLQSHFTGIFFLFAVAYLIYQKKLYQKFTTKILLFSLLGFLIPFVPLILFDFTHNFLNLKTFFSFFKHTLISTHGMLENFLVSIRSFSYFLPTLPFYIHYLLMVIWITLWIHFIKTHKKHFLTLFSLPVVTAQIVLFTIYRGSVSEYYFIPTILILTLIVVLTILKNKLLVAIFLPTLFCAFFIAGIQNKFSKNPLSIYNKMHVVEKLKDLTFSNIEIRTPPGYNNGLTYILHYYKIKPNESSNKKIWLVINEKEEYDINGYYYKLGRIGLFKP